MIPRIVKTFNYSRFGGEIDVRTSGKLGSGTTTIRDAKIKAQKIHVYSRFKPNENSARHEVEARQILRAALERLAKDTGREVLLHFPSGRIKIAVGATASPRKTTLLPADHEKTAAEITFLLKRSLGLKDVVKEHTPNQLSL